jgi:hypothetical protein
LPAPCGTHSRLKAQIFKNFDSPHRHNTVWKRSCAATCAAFILWLASPMEHQLQFAAWAHYAEAGESSWHKRWISFNQSCLQIHKSDKPGTKPLFSFSLSSIVAKKLGSSFERRHSAIVFTLLRNFIISFASQTDLESAVSLVTRVQEGLSGVLRLLCTCVWSHSSRRIRRGPVNSSFRGSRSCR